MPINVAPPRAQIQQIGAKSFMKTHFNFHIQLREFLILLNRISFYVGTIGVHCADHDLMASISILAGNLNSGRTYLITAVQEIR